MAKFGNWEFGKIGIREKGDFEKMEVREIGNRASGNSGKW